MIWRGELPEDGLSGFWHHGILCADGTVIHYSGMDGMKTLHNAQIQRTGMDAFTGPTPTHRVHTVLYSSSSRVAPADIIEERAESAIGTRDYRLLSRNCEAFARWCVVGDSNSAQAQGAWLGVAAAAVSLLVGGGILGAALTAMVAQRAWDARRNPSATRRGVHVTLEEGDSDSDA